ncbi:MAG: PAS domain S-box protein [Bacteroidetes bacterium]|nr:PAS domain S-box protein [Bacteroidota bacterium]
MNNRRKSKLPKTKVITKQIREKKPKTEVKGIPQNIRLNINDIESHLLKIVNSLQDVIIIFDKHGRYLKIFETSSKKNLSKPAEELTGKTLHDVFSKQQADYFLEKIKTAFRSKKPVEFEYSLLIKKRTYWFLGTLSKLNNKYVILFARDITKMKVAQETKKESQQLLRLVWENSADGMRLTNGDGIILMVNNAFCRLVDKRKSDLEGKPLSIIYPKEKSTVTIEEYRERFKNKTVNSYFEAESNLWNSKKIWFGVSNSFFELEDHEPYLLSIFRDISKRKEAEKQIVILAQALKNIGECVSITNLQGEILFVNSAFLKTFNYKEDELIGKKIEIIRTNNNSNVSYEKIHFETLRNGWQGELINRRKDGKEFPVFLSSSTILDESARPVALIGIIQDISERKRTEEKINQTLSLLNATLESTADGILVVDINGKVTGINQKFANMWNLPQDILSTMDDHILLMYVKEQLKNSEAFFSQINWLYEHPESESYDIIEFKDQRVFERYSVPQKLNNQIVGRVWSFHDITEKNKSEEALVESEKRFRSLFETSTEGICIMSDIFEECNEQLCILFNCAKEEIIGHSPWEFSPEFQPDGRSSKESALEKINNALNGIPQYFYWQHKRKDNVLIDAEISLKSFPLSGKNLIQGTVHDITERKNFEKIQKALYSISEAVNTTEDTQTLYSQIHAVIKTLMPADNFYIALYDEKDDLLTFPYFVDEFDVQPEPKKPGRGLTEYVLRSGVDIIITGDVDIKLRELGEVDLVGEPTAVWLGVVLKHEGKIIGVMVVQDYHNEKAYGETEKQILVFVSEQIALAIDRKRTSEELINYTKQLKANKDLLEERARELAHLNAQLADSEKMLKELNTSKDKLFSIIAHDLKSPFQPLIGLSEILIEEYDSITKEERDRFIRELNNTIKNQYKLVENLLDWSRIQTGRMEFLPEKINLAESVESNISLLNQNALAKNIELVNLVQNDFFVFADLNMLQSVIQNLISNAIKFTNPDGKVTISSEEKNSHIEISVSDTGVGMSNDVLNNIFRIDKHHSTLGTAQEKGTGLGLIICKELVEKNQGIIWIESEIKKGSKFTFTLKKA